MEKIKELAQLHPLSTKILEVDFSFCTLDRLPASVCQENLFVSQW